MFQTWKLLIMGVMTLFIYFRIFNSIFFIILIPFFIYLFIVMRVQKEIVDFEVVGSKIDLMLSSPSPLLDVNLILISDDGDFSRNLAELRRRMCNVVVVIGETPGLGLPQNADIIWKVKDFMKGEGPIYMKVIIIMILVILICLLFSSYLTKSFFD